MRIVIAGAGIAGLTVAALLRRQGHAPVVVERRAASEDPGYALALWPHGSRVFHAFGMHDELVAASEPMRRYVARDGHGSLLTASAMPTSIGDYGHLGLIEHADLVQLLRSAAADVEIRHGVGLHDAAPSTQREVRVELSDGTTETVDLLVGADGMNSRVRAQAIGSARRHDTGWACYVWWVDRSLATVGETTERWGSGSFLGTYPCRERVCVIAGAPVDVLSQGSMSRRERLGVLLEPYGVPVDALLAGLPPDHESLYLWPMADARSPRWVDGRVALVGDAAAGFLPTAGIGASMALESAAVLADELSRTNTAFLPNALELYVRRRRRRVERAQSQSRRLARLMFVRRPAAAALRDVGLRFASMQQLVGPLIDDLRRPI